MATATIPSDEVQAKARTLLEMRAQWSTVRNKRTGWRRIVVPSLGDDVGVRYVDPAGRCCSCDAGRRGLMCYHRLAVTESLHRDALAAWVDEQERSTAGLAGEGEVEMAFMETATRLRGDGAGRLIATYERLWPAEGE